MLFAMNQKLIAVVTLFIVSALTKADSDEFCVPESEGTEFMLHKTVESLQKWVSMEVKVHIKHLTQTIEKLKLELSESYHKSEVTVSALQTTVTHLQSEISEYKLFIKEATAYKETVKVELASQHEIIKQHAVIIQNLKATLNGSSSCANDCITDIKVSDSEDVAIWNGYGFKDSATEGYLLTGIHNFNKDAYADSVQRRKLLFKKQNEWKPLHA